MRRPVTALGFISTQPLDFELLAKSPVNSQDSASLTGFKTMGDTEHRINTLQDLRNFVVRPAIDDFGADLPSIQNRQ